MSDTQYDETKEIMVRMDDVRAAHMCSRGARTFCERYGINWSAFLKEGVSSTRLEEIGDYMGLQALEMAKKRIAAQQEGGGA